MAASGTAVTVLAPNGRRQTVKVSANTLLLQVLEDVCKQHGFNPEDHGLKFQRTVLDLTLQWRFANLPNNAKLEVVPSTRKPVVSDSQVRVALQLEDGSRLQGSFSCGQSLWELLTHFPQISVSELSETGSTPTCVYMRDEVSGVEALKKATLKSLGLTGGSAIVRFLLKKNTAEAEDGKGAETAAIPTPPFAKKSTLSPSSQPDPAPSHQESSKTKMPTENSSLVCPVKPVTAPTPASATNVQQDEVQKPQDTVQPKAPPVGGGMPEEDGEKAGPSGLNATPSSSSAPVAPFIPFSGGGQRLGGMDGSAVGRTLSTSSSCSSMTALTSVEESPKAKKAKSSYGSVTKHQAAANKPDKDMVQEAAFLGPVEREPLIYHLESISRHGEDHQDLPDEFFEVTVDDVRKRFAQLKSERKLLEEAPLLTKSLREAQMKEKMDRYPKVVLRVQFPDRHVLQGIFRPLETVAEVRHFVRSHLEDPKLNFYLFVTPPKTILDDPSVTLFQADLFPGALLYFGCDVKTDFYLKRELLGSSVSALQANKCVASLVLQSETPSSSCVPEEPPPPPEPTADASRSAQGEPDPTAKPNKTDPGKMPKWLKLPGKK